MLSGNGRHRRPRQAPALIVAAGVTGSAIAIPLLGATSASAADGTTWDRVAECESGGAWSADNGNGYYGGLQLTQDNWERYGGLVYAPSADQASRSQQIAIAEKVLDGEGLTAWPTCGPLSGLSKNSGHVEVDTGLGNGSSNEGGSSDSSGSSSSSDSSDSSYPSGSSSLTDTSREGGNSTKSDTSSDGGSQDSDRSDRATPKSDESGKSGRSDESSEASEGGTGGAGRHRGDSADEDATEGAGDAREDGAPGRHASRDSGSARESADGSYTVRNGDSLSTIADTLDLPGGWSGLYDANKKTVGADPDLILPGQSLAVDAESGEK
ncbi:transglycosylase family protein [Streptomyces sp. 142MFCol3.1]|uniref:LysM peptidoglycan-binding domain-containing protein n=1 Tax=Streptomyces sp. 142MFCol3.1 TaxID=1172179 RepID=UPI00041588DF|nr:transglycosylase family protein [Streptomyces sp. 142MFCol3.1]